jgi:lipopolysaccharide transport system permease protein
MNAHFVRLLRHQIGTELLNKYAGSVLGANWALANPLMTILVYVVLVSVILKTNLGGTTTPYEYAVFCLSGLGVWLSIQEAMTSSSTCIVRNAPVIRNVAVSAAIFPIAAVATSFITLAICGILLVVLRAVAGSPPSVTLLALPIVVVVHFVLMAGVAFYVAMVGAFFRDISQILPVLLQFVMLMTPILYARSDLPLGLRTLADFNPIALLVDAYRQILYFGAWPNWLELLAVGLVGAVLLLVGERLFRIAKVHFEAVIG